MKVTFNQEESKNVESIFTLAVRNADVNTARTILDLFDKIRIINNDNIIENETSKKSE